MNNISPMKSNNNRQALCVDRLHLRHSEYNSYQLFVQNFIYETYPHSGVK